MKISDKGLALIQNSEGFSATMYRCPAGYWTIGFGHRVLPEEMEKYKNTTLTVIQGLELLQSDLEVVYRAISSQVDVPLAQGQFDAVCDFIFNLGQGAFFGSTLRNMLNRGNYAGAALEFSKWVYGKDKTGRKVPLPGLVRRRKAEQDLFKNV